MDYKNPFRKIFYSISNGLFEESYTTNHLNLNPTTVISDEGKFFENKKEELSYYFDSNEKTTSYTGNSDIYVSFYFWMQNRMQYYERIYKKVQDVFSDVGGLCSIVLTIAELINYIVNQYIILYDMNVYMNEKENSKQFDKNIFGINIYDNYKIKNNNNYNKLYPPKIKYSNDDSNKSKFFKKEIDIFTKKNKNIKRKKAKKNTITLTNNSLDNKQILLNRNALNINNGIIKRKVEHSLTHINTKNILKGKIDQSNSFLNYNQNLNNKRDKDNRIIKEYKSKDNITNQKINYDKIKFIHYLAYIIPFSKWHSNMQIYSDFRIKMICEENLIMNYLNIDKMLKIIKEIKDENINQEIENI